MRRNRKTRPSDSEEESDSGSSDATVYNPRTRNGKKSLHPQNRGRPKAKRQRVSDASNKDTSPQPSTSGLNSQDLTEDYNTSESGLEDSDYEPVNDISRKTKKLHLTKKQKPPSKNESAKKQKAKKKSLNGTTSNDAAFDAKEVESLAHKLVYFLLMEDQKKYAIRRKAITTHVFKDEQYSPKLYNVVMKKANSILMKIYGMELIEVENQKDSYMIINILRSELGIHDFVEVPKLKQQQHGLILYLLTVIFMNDNVITEDELTNALKPLGIDLTSKRFHPIFGDVKKYITSELVKQMYLSYELISKESMRYEIKWGIRAKQEFDKRDLLQFTCQIMDDTTPESWRVQYRDAEKSANPQVNGNS